MTEARRPWSWSATFGQQLTVYHLLPFSLRAGFAWENRDRFSEELARRLPEFQIRAQDFDAVGLHDLPESYRRRYREWLRIAFPQRYVEAVDRRRRTIAEGFGGACPQPTGAPAVEILLMPSGLGTIRITQDVEWSTGTELRAIHASQTAFIHSYFKVGAHDPHQPEDLLGLLGPIRQAVLAVPNSDLDPRHRLTSQATISWPVVDFFVGFVVCSAHAGAPDPPPWTELFVAEEIGGITSCPLPLSPDSRLSCDALLVIGWDESLVAFPGRPSPRRDAHRQNVVEFFTLAAMHWTGLYDTNQLLYDAIPFLFRQDRSYRKLQLLRGVQAHLAELQHESKAPYLAEHEDDRKILSRMFQSWETEDVASNLEKRVFRGSCGLKTTP